MLGRMSSSVFHVLKSVGLIALSLSFALFDAYVLVCTYVLQVLVPQNRLRKRARRSPGFRPQTILVTGVGTAKGLSLARAFYQAGHDVIGADFEPGRLPVAGRFSKALRRFYKLPEVQKDGEAYRQKLRRILEKERAVLWVNCNGSQLTNVDAELAEAFRGESDCRSAQLSPHFTVQLQRKDVFCVLTKYAGLPIPETHSLQSRDEVHHVLNDNKCKKFLLKPLGAKAGAGTALLPRATVSETYGYVSRLQISPSEQYILQEQVSGKEYSSHALLIDGKIQCFVAFPSSDFVMHYDPLPPKSSLSQSMFRFTQEFVSRLNKPETGHVSFDFIVEEKPSEKGTWLGLNAIECNPRPHTAVLLFQDQAKLLSRRYLSATVVPGSMNGHAELPDDAIQWTGGQKFYWMGYDLVALALYPFLKLLLLKISISELTASLTDFAKHVLFWKDATFEIWDPLPWFWLYHVYWPARILGTVVQHRKWSRINISTGKVFED